MTRFRWGHSLSFLALALALAVFYAGARHLQMRSAEIIQQRRTLGGLQTLVGRADEVERLLSVYEAGQNADLFLNAPSPAMMSAQLQRQLQQSIAASQARFLRASEIAPVSRDGIDFAGVRLELSGTIESLAKTVIAIESARPLLSIERAEFNSDLDSGQTEHVPLHSLTIDVMAPMRLPQPVPGKAVLQ
jgi:type II secretion system (T2SS) protein M